VKRRDFIAGLGSAAAWPVVVRAQQVLPLVGVLKTRSEDDQEDSVERDAFEKGLAKFGWVAGRNVTIDYRAGAGDDGRIRALGAELVGKRPQVIVVRGTQASIIVKRLTASIPIVFLNVADPVESGLVASFPHPGGNATGFASVEFSGKWFGVLKEIAPNVTRVMLLYSPENPNWIGYQRALMAVASTLSIDVTASAVTTADEIERAFQSFGLQPGGGVVTVPSGFLGVNRERIAALAMLHRLPAIFPYRYFTASGGLVSYGSDTVDLMRQAASYVDRILKGEAPSDLPVQAPTKFEFVINLKTAKSLGLTIPETLLATADEVIQ
jgi:putative ABC transport system substrate-binding protein